MHVERWGAAPINTAPHQGYGLGLMAQPAPVKSQVKETLVSIIIAFALAFVFRAFVIEAFVIPTGSMAPTLLGAHMRFTGPETGYNWTVNLPESGGNTGPIAVKDWMSGRGVTYMNPARRSGDRILVFKYLYSLYDPQRWDAVVFKAPTQPQTNYIKRLIGLPGEQLALVDGDVFTRLPPAGEQPAENPWALSGWTIARKPERVQRAVWQTVFDSRYAPLPRTDEVFRSPWFGLGWQMDLQGNTAYRAVEGSGAVALAFQRAIEDQYPYNERSSVGGIYPVSDVRMRCNVQPEGPGLVATAILITRGHEFRASVEGETATLAMRPVAQAPDDPWQELARARLAQPLAPGRATPLEFWHADQALHLYVDGRRVAYAEYAWPLAERLRLATGLTVESLMREYSPHVPHALMTADYVKPLVRWEFSGADGTRPAVTLYAVGLDRDLFYQPGVYANRRREPDGAAKATHPANTPHLGRDHFFVCGDNSPQSEDARLWADPDPWVSHSIDSTRGVVPRDLLIGKAFFVYFPSLIKDTRSSIPVPDFGRMRFIW